jgi:subtilisin family serine protease
MNPLALVKLTTLMERTGGRPDLKIGVIDGPVFTQHPDLAGEHIHQIASAAGATCARPGSTACLHGTFVTGILAAKRNSPAPAICPDCTIVVRPIFPESISAGEQMPSATPRELARALVECIDAGVRVINLSLAIAERTSLVGVGQLAAALEQAAKRGVIIVAAAGNDGALGSSTITRHSWVIPVVACDARGRPTRDSNLGRSIGRRGLSAPGDAITSLGPDGQPLTLGGTSVAVPFVTGTIALLASLFPSASSAELILSVTRAGAVRRTSLVPPLLDADAAERALSTLTDGGERRGQSEIQRWHIRAERSRGVSSPASAIHH